MWGVCQSGVGGGEAGRLPPHTGSARSQQIGVYTYVFHVTLAKLFFTPKTGTKPPSSRVIDASKSTLKIENYATRCVLNNHSRVSILPWNGCLKHIIFKYYKIYLHCKQNDDVTEE